MKALSALSNKCLLWLLGEVMHSVLQPNATGLLTHPPYKSTVGFCSVLVGAVL